MARRRRQGCDVLTRGNEADSGKNAKQDKERSAGEKLPRMSQQLAERTLQWIVMIGIVVALRGCGVAGRAAERSNQAGALNLADTLWVNVGLNDQRLDRQSEYRENNEQSA